MSGESKYVRVERAWLEEHRDEAASHMEGADIEEFKLAEGAGLAFRVVLAHATPCVDIEEVVEAVREKGLSSEDVYYFGPEPDKIFEIALDAVLAEAKGE